MPGTNVSGTHFGTALLPEGGQTRMSVIHDLLLIDWSLPLNLCSTYTLFGLSCPLGISTSLCKKKPSANKLTLG